MLSVLSEICLRTKSWRGSRFGTSSPRQFRGNAIAKVKSNDSIKVLTFRPTAFEPVELGSGEAPVEVIPEEAYASAG
eukprot:4126858-Amphidinium_carterae.1